MSGDNTSVCRPSPHYCSTNLSSVCRPSPHHYSTNLSSVCRRRLHHFPPAYHASVRQGRTTALQAIHIEIVGISRRASTLLYLLYVQVRLGQVKVLQATNTNKHKYSYFNVHTYKLGGAILEYSRDMYFWKHFKLSMLMATCRKHGILS